MAGALDAHSLIQHIHHVYYSICVSVSSEKVRFVTTCYMELNSTSFVFFYLLCVNLQYQKDNNCSYTVVFLCSRNGRFFFNRLPEKLGS